MNFRPSSIDYLLAALPDDLQAMALQAIIDERNRIERGAYTEEERAMFENIDSLGWSAAETLDKLMCGIIQKTL